MLVYCMNLKKIGKALTSKSVGTGPSSYEKRIYRAAVSQRLRNTGLNQCGRKWHRGDSKEYIFCVGYLSNFIWLLDWAVFMGFFHNKQHLT